MSRSRSAGCSYELALETLIVHALVDSRPMAQAILDECLQACGDLLAHIHR